jgi:hypothetical protein
VELVVAVELVRVDVEVELVVAVELVIIDMLVEELVVDIYVVVNVVTLSSEAPLFLTFIVPNFW